jgi:hypothetical protein
MDTDGFSEGTKDGNRLILGEWLGVQVGGVENIDGLSEGTEVGRKLVS